MDGSPSHPKPLHSLHVFSMKSPPSSAVTPMKFKTLGLVHTVIFSRLCRVARALSKAKSVLVELVRETQLVDRLIEQLRKNKNKKQRKLFGSFRLHYNWCSSHVMPVSTADLDGHVYYDSTWNSMISNPCEDSTHESQLSGYLRWLEERKVNDNSAVEHINEIDRLADMFIASCHEKFRLEKQESYRRFQEMMARSV